NRMAEFDARRTRLPRPPTGMASASRCPDARLCVVEAWRSLEHHHLASELVHELGLAARTSSRIAPAFLAAADPQTPHRGPIGSRRCEFVVLKFLRLGRRIDVRYLRLGVREVRREVLWASPRSSRARALRGSLLPRRVLLF